MEPYKEYLRFERDNKIAQDLYYYDKKQHGTELAEKRWNEDPMYFKRAEISSLALIKMADHAHNGGDIEVMGLLQGKVQGTSIVVMDVFALPVEGTETRVNAQQEAYEYMVRYLENSKKVGREENVIGWYHSHPGYGCWLSGIDVNTQKLNQRYQDPWLAIVIDPKKTVESLKVDIGAFRTYPEDYSPDIPTSRKADSLPSEKIEDFGMHSNMYYQLDVSYFKSNIDKQVLDSIWTQYWGNVLSKKITTAHTKSLELKIRAEAEKLEILADSTPPSAPKDQVYGGKLANFPVVMQNLSREYKTVLKSEELKSNLF